MNNSIKRLAMIHFALFAACIVIGVVGCATAPDLTPVARTVEVFTNVAPVLTAAAGATSVVPSTAPISPLLGAAAALLSALGGWGAHYLSTRQVANKPTAPVAK